MPKNKPYPDESEKEFQKRRQLQNKLRPDIKGLRGKLKELKSSDKTTGVDTQALANIRERLSSFRDLRRQGDPNAEHGRSKRAPSERPFDPAYEGDKFGPEGKVKPGPDQWAAPGSKAERALAKRFLASQGRLTPVGPKPMGPQKHPLAEQMISQQRVPPGQRRRKRKPFGRTPPPGGPPQPRF